MQRPTALIACVALALCSCRACSSTTAAGTDAGQDTSDASSGVPDTAGEEVDMAGPPIGYDPPAAACSRDDPPLRCSEDAATFDDWGEAFLLTSVRMVGDPDEQRCCFDLDDDGEVDNELGFMFANSESLGGSDALPDFNDDLQDSIDDGEQAWALELDGFDPQAPETPFAVNVWAVDASAKDGTVEIVPASIDEGVHPVHRFESAEITGGELQARDGTFEFRTSYYGYPLDAIVTDARFDAPVEGLQTQDPVTVETAELGGAIEVAQVFHDTNEFAATCECLPIEGEILEFESGQACVDANDANLGACEDLERTDCVAVVELCGVVSFLPGIADLNPDDHPEYRTHVSVGMELDTTPVEITGVASE